MLKSVNTAILFIPYRPFSFRSFYGNSVRDWAFIKTLIRCINEESIAIDYFVLDRPNLSLRKPALPKYVKKHQYLPGGFINPVSVLMYGRGFSIPRVERTIVRLKEKYAKVVVIDFDPFSKAYTFDGCVQWFDEIDDFAKHSRIPEKDKERFLNKRASNFAKHTVGDLTNTKYDIIQNWAFLDGKEVNSKNREFEFLFGYVGFVDAKIDVPLLQRLSKFGSIIIYGKCLDKAVFQKLSSIDNLVLKGEYVLRDLPVLMSTFRHGIIPFHPQLIHGNSPIKYFQYSTFYKLVFSTVTFGLTRDNLLSFPDSLSELDRLNGKNVDWDSIFLNNSASVRELKRSFVEFINRELL